MDRDHPRGIENAAAVFPQPPKRGAVALAAAALGLSRRHRDDRSASDAIEPALFLVLPTRLDVAFRPGRGRACPRGAEALDEESLAASWGLADRAARLR